MIKNCMDITITIVSLVSSSLRIPTVTIVTFIFLTGIFVKQPLAKPPEAYTGPCESDTRTLADLLKATPPLSTKVPKDFKIRQHVERYVDVNPLVVYSLPSTKDHAVVYGREMENVRNTDRCIVTSPDGVEWVAGGQKDQPMCYTLKSAVMPERIYNARADAGNAAWDKCSANYLAEEKAGTIPYNSPNDCIEQSEKASDQAEKELNYGNK